MVCPLFVGGHLGFFHLLAIVNDVREATLMLYLIPGPLCVSLVSQVHSTHCSMARRGKKDHARIGH